MSLWTAALKPRMFSVENTLHNYLKTGAFMWHQTFPFVSFCISALNCLSYSAHICSCYILLRGHMKTYCSKLPFEFKKANTACFECLQLSDFRQMKTFEYVIIHSYTSTMCIQPKSSCKLFRIFLCVCVFTI